jgi:hypothetical protein
MERMLITDRTEDRIPRRTEKARSGYGVYFY